MDELRFIDFGCQSVQKIMSYNEALFRTSEKTCEPVGFIWTTPPAIIMGYSQLIERELDTGRCRALGYQITRRISGGGMAFSSKESQIQYGYIGRLEDLPYDITESYQEICGIVVEALRRWGLEGKFQAHKMTSYATEKDIRLSPDPRRKSPPTAWDASRRLQHKRDAHMLQHTP